MTTRRRFMFMIPASGAVLAAACSDQATPPPAAPEAAPAAPPATPMTPQEEPVPATPSAAPPDVGAGPMLDEADAAAVALGYVADTTRADKTKYPKHATDQACANCALYQGTAGAESGPCPLFPGKQVAAKGWCSSYVKKPS